MGYLNKADEQQAARRLVLTAPRTLEIERCVLPPLAPDEVRIRTLLSGISAGTELAQYRSTSPFLTRHWNPDLRLFLDEPGDPMPIRHLGYGEVGELVAVGSGVKDLEPGRLIFGTWGHADWHQMRADDAADRLLPGGADPQIGIFSHIGAVALNGVHDAGIRAGDVVGVFGLGVPGQIVAQASRLSGATVIGIDPVTERRNLALSLGAQRVLDPADGSVGERLKRETGGRGLDIAIEVSGAVPALAEALRSVAYASRVVAMGFFQGGAEQLHLGEEFHLNRLELISSQISGVSPVHSHRWNRLRLWQTVIKMQHESRLSLTPLITDRMPFEAAPEFFKRLDNGESAGLQAVLEFA